MSSRHSLHSHLLILDPPLSRQKTRQLKDAGEQRIVTLGDLRDRCGIVSRADLFHLSNADRHELVRTLLLEIGKYTNVYVQTDLPANLVDMVLATCAALDVPVERMKSCLG